MRQKQKTDTPNGVSFFWGGRTDSNHRSDTQQIYSLSPLATRELSHILFYGGAGRRIRTPDLLITNQLLYRLSYTSPYKCTRLVPNNISIPVCVCQRKVHKFSAFAAKYEKTVRAKLQYGNKRPHPATNRGIFYTVSITKEVPP